MFTQFSNVVSICKQPEDTFIKNMAASAKIDFYFEVFVSNWKTMRLVISQEQYSIKTLEFTETNNYFYSFTYEKTYLAIYLTSG